MRHRIYIKVLLSGPLQISHTPSSLNHHHIHPPTHPSMHARHHVLLQGFLSSHWANDPFSPACFSFMRTGTEMLISLWLWLVQTSQGNRITSNISFVYSWVFVLLPGKLKNNWLEVLIRTGLCILVLHGAQLIRGINVPLKGSGDHLIWAQYHQKHCVEREAGKEKKKKKINAYLWFLSMY